MSECDLDRLVCAEIAPNLPIELTSPHPVPPVLGLIVFLVFLRRNVQRVATFKTLRVR